ncbi:MAG: hypothetical protein WC718_01750 [Phycisphaerales bacterium]|jgi:hypothetical protein
MGYTFWQMYASDACFWLAFIALVRWCFGVRPSAPHCRRCQYDLSGHSTGAARRLASAVICPECGARHNTRRQLLRRCSPKWAMPVFMVAAIAWYGLGVWPRIPRHGWRGAVPSGMLIVATPWIAPRPMHCGMALFEPPGSLDEELNRRNLAWPCDDLAAVRNRLFPYTGEPGTYFYATRVKPRWRSMLESVPSFGLFVDDGYDPWQSSDLWWDLAPNDYNGHGCDFFGGWIFASVDSPTRFPAIEDVARAMRAAAAANPAKYITPDHFRDMNLIARLAHTNVALEPRYATFLEQFKSIARESGIPLKPEHECLWSDGRACTDLAETPSPGSALAVLDDLFAYRDTETGSHSSTSLAAWSVSHGALVLGTSPSIASAFPMVHDYSPLVSSQSTSPMLDWRAIERRFMFELSETLDAPGHHIYRGTSRPSDKELPEGWLSAPSDDSSLHAIPFDTGRVMIYASPRMQYELANFINRHSPQRANSTCASPG